MPDDTNQNWYAISSETEKLGQGIIDKISEYHQELARNSPNVQSLATSIRTLLKKFSANTTSLKKALTRSVAQGTISANESERRQRLLDDLITTEKRLEQAFTTRSTATSNRTFLLGGTSTTLSSSGNVGQHQPGGRPNPWLAGEETDDTRAITTQDIHAQHHQVLQEQDRGLDALSKAVGRQREMAVDIAAEVDIHNDILGEISEELERADTRLSRETRNIKVIMKKSKTHWCMWLLIVLLLISIFVIAVVPKP